MMIDSLEMTDADRASIVERCRAGRPNRASSITHGTDTMVETAAALAAALPAAAGKTIVLTGAMIPLCVRQLGWTVQSRQRPVVRSGAAAGCLHRDEWTLFRMGPREEESGHRSLRGHMNL